MSNIKWSSLMEEYKKRPESMYEWFVSFKVQFDQINDYSRKLQFWCSKDLPAWIYKLDHLKHTVEIFVGNLNAIYENNEERCEYLIVVPQNEQDFNIFFWASVERGMKSKNMYDTRAEEMKASYWQSMSLSPSPKDFLEDESDRVVKVFKTYESDSNSLISSVFHNAYKLTLRGKNAILDFYNNNYVPLTKPTFQSDPDIYFVHLARGIAYAYYRGFLTEQVTRMKQGQAFQKPEPTYTLLQTDQPIDQSYIEDTIFDNNAEWSALSTEEQEKFTLGFEEYMRHKNELSKMGNYQEQLNYWTINNLKGLTYLIDTGLRTISHWGNKCIAIYMLPSDSSLTHITIEPQNAQECKEFVLWSIEKNNRNGCNTINCYSEQLIKLYWERINKSTSHKEYLINQISEIQSFIEKQQKASNNTLSALFLHSYDNCMNGLESFNFNELYHLLLANAKPYDLVLLWDSCALFPNLLRGKAYAEYKGFLLNQEDRMRRGEDIRKQETEAPVIPKVVYKKVEGSSLLSDLHPKVQEVATRLFEDGHYRQALFDTYIALNLAVKQKSGLHLDNTPLMQSAFSPKNSVITVSASSDEQQGFMWLFSGAMMAIRNPKAHQLTEDNDPQQALEWLFFASALFKVLDKSESSFE